MTYLDNRGLIAKHRARAAHSTGGLVSDSLSELDYLLVSEPPPWPTRRWYHTDRGWAKKLRAYVDEWWGYSQPVRIRGTGQFGGRMGEIQAHDWPSAECVHVRVALYGGRVGTLIDPAKPIWAILREDCEWISSRNREAACAADRATVRLQREELNAVIRLPDDQPAFDPPVPRDGILHPHRRLDV
jgi:hypothetical protein